MLRRLVRRWAVRTFGAESVDGALAVESVRAAIEETA